MINSGVSLIIDCSPGKHEYKFFIDGAWYHDPTKVSISNYDIFKPQFRFYKILFFNS
ncbi:unnamed protein product [Protopolystoma xenopodis]|uniref:AMP-activated protein kinase glycogen-binding domain-containing protein n=1 Tax=Protopolystoma xenopodis TaxID=117903 RepID=A0A3S5A4G4_9PLAT|nr:unnamed protein product [Protopolystoma xenopodis]